MYLLQRPPAAALTTGLTEWLNGLSGGSAIPSASSSGS
jgi:fructose-specific phosphotransferase system IIC component